MRARKGLLKEIENRFSFRGALWRGVNTNLGKMIEQCSDILNK